MNPKVTANRQKEKKRYTPGFPKWLQIGKRRKKDNSQFSKVTVNQEKEKIGYTSGGEKWPQIAKRRKADTFPTPVSDRKSQKGEN